MKKINNICCASSGCNFGILILLIGAIWLAKDLGYIPAVPIWPTIFIVIGLSIIINSIKKRTVRE